MDVFRRLAGLPPFRGGTAVAIGNFDGLHAGHRRILGRAMTVARRKNLYSLVLTFDPRPSVSPARRPVPLLRTLDRRLSDLSSLGVRGTLVLPFNMTFAALSGRAFAESILAGALRARAVAVGENFRFGHDRRCGVAELKAFGETFGFKVYVIPTLVRDGLPISSSLIRKRLAEGDVETAAALLGSPYEIEGRVVRGTGRGTPLGIPTANLRTSAGILPPGVYLTLAVSARRAIPSVTNVGTGPTLGPRPVHVETHLLDVREDLYGTDLRVLFLKKLRNERKFPSVPALVLQIRKDIKKARAAFDLPARA
jgi:riboflavin kinase / FMN adenylyltransferase